MRIPRWASALLLMAILMTVLWLADRWEARLPGGETIFPGDMPVFSPPGGEFSGRTTVEIRPSHSRAQVIFTTDGAVPTATVGLLYDHPLVLDSAFPGVVVLRARQFVNGQPGPITSTSYVVGVEHTIPILSLIADPSDLWAPGTGMIASPRRGAEGERPVHLTFLTGEPLAAFEADAGLRLLSIENSGKPSFRLYFRREYGLSRLEYPLFPIHPEQDVHSYKRLLLLAGDRSARWTLMEDALLSGLATDLGLTAPLGRFVLLFINGQPWGIYYLSEQVDRFFAEDGLGLPGATIIRNGQAEEGDQAQWDGLVTWVRTHDLKDSSHFARLQNQIDLNRFTDFAILQMYFGLPDFIAICPEDGAGPWEWIPLEVHSWAHLYSGPMKLPDLPVSDILSRLLEVPEYRMLFVTRLADLLNTTLSPASAERHIDRMYAQLSPDIRYESARWPSPQEWESNVGALREFVRHRPDVLRQQIAQRWGLEGTAPLTLTVSPENAGRVFVNGTVVPTMPWQGLYFLGTPVQVTAVPALGYVFAGWEGAPADSPQITITIKGPLSLQARFVPRSAAPTDVLPNDVIINEFWINDNGTRYLSLGNRPIEGDWIELLVLRGPVDLRGWRLTDNDTKTGTDEGSIIFPDRPEFAAVPRGTVILIIATENPNHTTYFSQDDMDARDRRMVLYVGNGNLDVGTDPGFGLGIHDDNLALLAPGPTADFADDIGVDFVAEGTRVTSFSFGILAGGVMGVQFQGLGNDDGAIFVGTGRGNDDFREWQVDPPAHRTGDAMQMDAINILTPGALNHGQWAIMLPWRR